MQTINILVYFLSVFYLMEQNLSYTMLYRLFPLNIILLAFSHFSDILPNHYFKRYIEFYPMTVP